MIDDDLKEMDPAILSLGATQPDNRIRYSAEILLNLQCVPESLKLPELKTIEPITKYITSGKKNYEQLEDLKQNGLKSSVTQRKSNWFRLTKEKVPKPLNKDAVDVAPVRKSVFMSGPQLTSTSSYSGRIQKDIPWNNHNPYDDHDNNGYRSGSRFHGILNRDIETSMEQLKKQQHFNQLFQRDSMESHNFREPNRENRQFYPQKDRFDKYTFGRDNEYDKNRYHGNGGVNNNNNNRPFKNNIQNNGQQRYSDHSSEDHRRRSYENSNEEPEWFSGGPTSQNDVIELRGFDDSDEMLSSYPGKKQQNLSNSSIRTEDDQFNKVKHDMDNDYINNSIMTNTTSHNSSPPPARSTPTKADSNNNNNNNEITRKAERPRQLNTGKSGDDDFNFEEFLKMDTITELLTPDELQHDEAESRFSRWFNTDGTTNNRHFKSNDHFGKQHPSVQSNNIGSANPLLDILQNGKNQSKRNMEHRMKSVEELEAGIRKPIDNNNIQQQDAMAFQHLLLKIKSMQPVQQQMNMQQNQQFQQEQQTAAIGLMQLLSRNQQQQVPLQKNDFLNKLMLQQQQQRLIQQQQQQQSHSETLQKVIQIGQHLHLNRNEILKRPEAQALIQGVCAGQINQQTLLNQLRNPIANAYQRENLMAVLNLFVGSGSASSFNAPQLNSFLPKPNINNNIKLSNNATQVPQRIPSPREMHYHTQSIMQNALMKKQLDEQIELFQKQQLHQFQQQILQQNNNHQPPANYANRKSSIISLAAPPSSPVTPIMTAEKIAKIKSTN